MLLGLAHAQLAAHQDLDSRAVPRQSHPPSQGQDFASLSTEFHKVPVVSFHLVALQIALLHNILGSLFFGPSHRSPMIPNSHSTPVYSVK